MLDLNTNQELVGSLATIFPDESVHAYNIFTIQMKKNTASTLQRYNIPAI